MSKELTQGTKLNNRYVIQKVLGKGGFGITYMALDTLVDVPVAIKQYENSNKKDQELAMREVKMAARFYDLEGIASARDFFVEQEISYIVMEYVEGLSIKKYVYEQGSMKGSDILQKLKPVLQSLCTIHKEGIIHRDISPDNLMLTKRGTLQLIDFGEARQFSTQTSKTMTLVYKKGFSPIEQRREHGKQGAYTDIYSICATIYFAVTGMVPDDAIERLIADYVKPLSQIHGTGLSKREEAAIMKGLEIFPEKRFQTMEEFYRQLYLDEPIVAEVEELKDFDEYYTKRKVFNTAHVLNEIDDFFDNNKKRKKRNRLLGILLIVASCMFLLGIVIYIGKEGRDNSEDVKIGVTKSPTPTIQKEMSTPQPTEAPEYKILNYVGMKQKSVKKKLRSYIKKGMKVRYKTKYSNQPKGEVLSQNIKAGKSYKDLTKVILILTISKGKKPQPTKTPEATFVPKQTTPKPNQGNAIDFDGDLDAL